MMNPIPGGTVFNIKQTAVSAVVFAMALAGTGRVWAQPTPIPTTGDKLCSIDTSAANQIDTVAAPPIVNSEGTYFSLFDGTTFKGWWQDCQSGHSSADRVNGAIWRISATNTAIYSTQRNGNTGGLLATHKKYANYEIVFDMWPTYGDDGGLFNRTSLTGAAYQTTLDYIGAGAFGGVWGEGGYTGRDIRPSAFNGNASTLTIPGNAGNIGWTAWSNAYPGGPASFGCSVGGCTQANWVTLWNTAGWNQVRIKFYGGMTAATKVHMDCFMRRSGATVWVPLWTDSLVHTDPPSWIALQVHGGGRFPGGNWYKNIMIRPLDNLGNPTGVVSISPMGRLHYGIQSTFGALMGTLDLSHVITVSDMNGRVVEKFSGPAGNFKYAFSSKARGLLFMEVKTARGIEFQRVSRVSE